MYASKGGFRLCLERVIHTGEYMYTGILIHCVGVTIRKGMFFIMFRFGYVVSQITFIT